MFLCVVYICEFVTCAYEFVTCMSHIETAVTPPAGPKLEKCVIFDFQKSKSEVVIYFDMSLVVYISKFVTCAFEFMTLKPEFVM